MKKYHLLIPLIFLFGTLTIAQNNSINFSLESIPTSDDAELNSPIGEPDFLWACAATIKMPDFEERNNITCKIE